MGHSTYLRDKINDHIRGGTAFTQPVSLWVKMHTGAPGLAGTANAAVETTRHQATFGTASSGGVIANTATVPWLSIAASESWTNFTVWDASTAGNCLGDGTLTGGAGLIAGQNVTIPIGGLTWTQT